MIVMLDVKKPPLTDVVDFAAASDLVAGDDTDLDEWFTARKRSKNELAAMIQQLVLVARAHLHNVDVQHVSMNKLTEDMELASARHSQVTRELDAEIVDLQEQLSHWRELFQAAFDARNAQVDLRRALQKANEADLRLAEFGVTFDYGVD